MGSDSPRAATEGVMITSRKRETKTVRNEQLEVCRVWEEGRRISWSESLTKQMPCHSAALSPVPPATAAPCSCRLHSPKRSRRLWDLLCSNWGAEMVIFWKKNFFKSIHDCAYVAKSTALVLSKGRNSPQFNKYEKNLRQIKKISHWGNEFHITSPAQKAARVSWTPVHVHVLWIGFSEQA